MNVDFVDEFVEVVLMSFAQVDEGLNGLIGVSRDVLPLSGGDYGDGIIGKGGEVCN